MKKLLGLLITTPLVITSCGGPGDFIPDEVPGISEPGDYNGRAYALTDGQYVYDNFRIDSNSTHGSRYFNITDLRSTNGWYNSYNNLTDDDGYVWTNQNKCYTFNSSYPEDMMAAISAMINNPAGADAQKGDYLIPNNNYFLGMTRAYGAGGATTNGAASTAAETRIVTTSGIRGTCFFSGAVWGEIDATTSTVAASNLSVANVDVNSNFEVTKVEINQTEMTGNNNDEYAWTGNYFDSGVSQTGYKDITVQDADEIYKLHDGELEWKYNFDNRETEWYKTIVQIKEVFEGLTLAEAEAVDLEGDWMPSVVTGANANMENRIHYAQLIVEAIKIATEEANNSQ